MTTKSNPDAPRRAAPRQRSGGKARAKAWRPAGPSARYTAEQRGKALELVKAKGTAHAHHVTGIPKPTLSRWCRDAGVDVGDTARSQTQHATEAVRARAAEVRLGTVELLEQHIAQAGDYLSTVAGVNALAARLIAQGDPDKIVVRTGMAGPYAVVEQGQAAELAKVALALAGLPMAVRDAEGILTRAVHDLQLLRGEATERGELVVEFDVPRPAANGDASARVIDTQPIDS